LNLAIIPARGGSKRIPYKNIKEFCGKPILTYSIDAAVNSRLFDEVMVSTDDEQIAMIATTSKAKIPFMRSTENSDDYTALNSVVIEVINEYKKRGLTFDNFCCILPTAPFITEDLLQKSYELLIRKKANIVFPIVKFSYPIQRALRLNDTFVEMVNPENYYKRSQDFEERYHDSGLFYWGHTEFFIENPKFFGDKSVGLPIHPSIAQDIDTIEDWEIAEIKYRILKNKTNG